MKVIVKQREKESTGELKQKITALVAKRIHEQPFAGDWWVNSARVTAPGFVLATIHRGGFNSEYEAHITIEMTRVP